MSEPLSTKTHIAIWCVSASALAAVYVLSWAPVVERYDRMDPFAYYPEWADNFYAPAGWLYDHTALQGPMEAYAAWWRKTLRKP